MTPETMQAVNQCSSFIDTASVPQMVGTVLLGGIALVTSLTRHSIPGFVRLVAEGLMKIAKK